MALRRMGTKLALLARQRDHLAKSALWIVPDIHPNVSGNFLGRRHIPESRFLFTSSKRPQESTGQKDLGEKSNLEKPKPENLEKPKPENLEKPKPENLEKPKLENVEKPKSENLDKAKDDKLLKTWASSKLKELRHELREVPPLAKTLGLAGALPFVALAPPLVYILPLPEILNHGYAEAQAAYGAAILSFLGGPHWGTAMVDKSHRGTISGVTVTSARYLWSVTPCLLAWFSLLLPTVPKLEVLLLSFGSAAMVDFFMMKAKLVPSWYLPLRMLLTAIAMASMGSSLLVEASKETLEAATATAAS